VAISSAFERTLIYHIISYHIVYIPRTGTATSDFSMNSLLCCCCMPTTHCNKSRGSIDLLEKLCLRHTLCPTLQHLATL